VLGAIVGALAVGGIAYASIPDGGGVFHACYKKSGGQLRLVESPKDCGPSETPAQWNQTGQAGQTGPTGPSGTSAGYAASGSHFLEADAPATEELVGVSGLPAGSYIIWATIFTHLGDDIVCDLTHGTQPVQPGAPVHYRTGNSMTMTSFVRNAPANASFFVRCGQTGGDPEAFAKIEAIKVDTLQ
jgi:hypothetical protein